MIFIISGITGLLIIVALFTFFSRSKKSDRDGIIAPPADCCGAHEVCEKGLRRINQEIIYFDDEELDHYRHISENQYSDKQIDDFRDILYTLRREEINDWLISLEQREISLPEILRQEVVELL